MTKNQINGKSYIGCHSTDNLMDGYYGSGHKLLEDIKIYGRKKFITGIIELCEKKNLHQQEKYWIDFYDTFNTGYNLNRGGGGTYGKKHKPETLKKISNSLKNPSENTRKKMRDGQLNRIDNIGLFRIWENKFSKEEIKIKMEKYREKMSIALKGKNLGKKLSMEAKIKIGKSGKGRIFTDEQKEKIRKASMRKGRILKKMTCNFCGKSGKGGNMTRYHFNNCNHRNESIIS